MGAHFQEPKEPPQEKSPPTTHHSDVMLRPIVFDVSRSIAVWAVNRELHIDYGDVVIRGPRATLV